MIFGQLKIGDQFLLAEEPEVRCVKTHEHYYGVLTTKLGLIGRYHLSSATTVQETSKDETGRRQKQTDTPIGG